MKQCSKPTCDINSLNCASFMEPLLLPSSPILTRVGMTSFLMISGLALVRSGMPPMKEKLLPTGPLPPPRPMKGWMGPAPRPFM